MSVGVLGRAVHLVSAVEVFDQGYPNTFLALCGESMTDEPNAGEDPRYCRACVLAAIRWGAPW